jgi:hypothetical protein
VPRDGPFQPTALEIRGPLSTAGDSCASRLGAIETSDQDSHHPGTHRHLLEPVPDRCGLSTPLVLAIELLPCVPLALIGALTSPHRSHAPSSVAGNR